MSESLDRPRNSCALHGAIQTLKNIDRVVPIIHSISGCGIQQYLGKGNVGTSGFIVSSTNVIEKQVIFGGSSRLREQIKNTVKVIDADLYIALSGCSPELVGDDIISMTQEAKDQGEPVIFYKAPGFKSKTHSGYEGVVNSIINQLPAVMKIDNEKQDNLVNILGIIPEQDLYWRGSLEEIKRILQGIGLKVNTLFGVGQGIDNWKNISAGKLNIVFSKWGMNIAKNLKDKYETDFIEFNYMPVGNLDTIHFLEEVARKLEINLDVVKRFTDIEEKRVNYYLDNILELYFKYNFQKTFAIVGDESNVIGITNFLTKYLGLIPKTVVITDKTIEDNNRTLINEVLEKLTNDIKIYVSEDSGEIESIIEKSNVELVFGSSLEKNIAEKLNIPLKIISFPAINNVILNKTYVGFNGSITLLEDLSELLLNSEVEKNNKIAEKIKKIVNK